MAQPTAYTPSHSFVADEALDPNIPGSELDVEFAAIETTTDEIRANLVLIQRDDGALKNAVVTTDSLSAGVLDLIDTGGGTLPTETFGVALSDETTALSAGAGKATFSLPYAVTVVSVYATLNTASSSGAVVVDINEAGVSILSTKLSIDVNEKNSSTAATAAVLSDTAIAANAEIGFDIDSAGTAAKGLKVFMQVRRA